MPQTTARDPGSEGASVVQPPRLYVRNADECRCKSWTSFRELAIGIFGEPQRRLSVWRQARAALPNCKLAGRGAAARPTFSAAGSL